MPAIPLYNCAMLCQAAGVLACIPYLCMPFQTRVGWIEVGLIYGGWCLPFADSCTRLQTQSKVPILLVCLCLSLLAFDFCQMQAVCISFVSKMLRVCLRIFDCCVCQGRLQHVRCSAQKRTRCLLENVWQCCTESSYVRSCAVHTVCCALADL